MHDWHFKNNSKNSKYQKTASDDPGLFLGPSELRLAKSGKYTTENETSLSMVAELPLYKPRIPLVRSNSLVMLMAEIFLAAAPPIRKSNKHFGHFVSPILCTFNNIKNINQENSMTASFL